MPDDGFTLNEHVEHASGDHNPETLRQEGGFREFLTFAVIGLVACAIILSFAAPFFNRSEGAPSNAVDDDDNELKFVQVNPATCLPMDDDGIMDDGGNTFGSGSSSDSDSFFDSTSNSDD
ncbi:hypothetical protein FG94_00416 [Massilia sp. LC238]|nr:hypothetical protein FG94_00416 [Massilia sp. LC238]